MARVACLVPYQRAGEEVLDEGQHGGELGHVAGGVVLQVQDAHLARAQVLPELDVHGHAQAAVQVLEAEVTQVVAVLLGRRVRVDVHTVQILGQLGQRHHVPAEQKGAGSNPTTNFFFKLLFTDPCD